MLKAMYGALTMSDNSHIRKYLCVCNSCFAQHIPEIATLIEIASKAVHSATSLMRQCCGERKHVRVCSPRRQRRRTRTRTMRWQLIETADAFWRCRCAVRRRLWSASRRTNQSPRRWRVWRQQCQVCRPRHGRRCRCECVSPCRQSGTARKYEK